MVRQVRPVHARTRQTFASRNSGRVGSKDRVRPRTYRTASPRSPRQPDVGRQTQPVGTVLRRFGGPIQSHLACNHGRFSTGFTTGGRTRRSRSRHEQHRRLYEHDRPTTAVRGPRSLRAVPRDDANDCRTAVEGEAGSGAVHVGADSTT